MDKIKIERTWLQGSPVQVDNLMGNAFVGEAGAHEFLISGKDNAGNVVPITGTITGKFLSSTMTTFALSGYVTEGVASVTLPSECYGAPGQFVVSIFATNGSITTCIYCGVGSIFRTSTAAIAYPTTTLPDLTLLINQLDDVIASFPADLTHLLGAIAPTFVDNQPFTAGQYVWYDQVLYRFTVDHPAGSWAGSADTVVAVIGTELNSTVRYTQQVLTDAQKTVARTNIDAADADDVTDLELTTVQVTPQTFDDNSKSQARSNIGAASSGDLSTLSGLVSQQGGYISDLSAAVGTVPTGETVEGQITDLKSALAYDEGVLDAISDPVTEEATGTKTTNKFINYNAVVADANANYYIYTFPVSVGDRFLINGAAGSGGYLYIFTDSNNNTIGKSEKNTGSTIQSYRNISAVAPENAVYLIVGSNISSGTTQVLVRKITGYSVNGISELDNRIDVIENILVDVTETASASSSDWTEHDGEYMFTSGSTTTGTGWRYIEYPIPSNATALIVKATVGQSARLWILKDASNTVLGYSDDSSSASVKTETVNLSNYTGATKLFVNDKDSSDLSIQYQYTAKKVSGDDIEWDGATIDEVLASNPLWGKILCCAGDSITYGADMDAEGITNTSNITVYQSDAIGNFTQTQTGFLKTWNWQIASRNKMTLYNAGVSGSTMQGQNGVNGFSLANGRYTKLPDSIDYLLIWFGWNDNAYGTLGTINDNTNASYYGGYNIVLPYLINKYPYAKIGLIVPFGSSAGHREAVRLLGNKWGCAVWDNYQGGTPLYFGKETSVGVEESIVTANRAKFQANGAHPNYKGHRQLADMIEEWLKGI